MYSFIFYLEENLFSSITNIVVVFSIIKLYWK